MTLILKFSVTAFFALMSSRECQGLASGAIYRIQNVGTKQCISAGPIISNEGKNMSTKLTLFKEGQIQTKPCSNFNASSSPSPLGSLDFSQQWMVKIEKEEVPNLAFHVKLAFENAVYNDTRLNATLSGEVISYFPKLLRLQGIGLPGNRKNQSHQFLITNATSHQCLTDELSSPSSKELVHYKNCSSSTASQKDRDSQKWNFILVNDIELTRMQVEMMKHMNTTAPPPHKHNHNHHH